MNLKEYPPRALEAIEVCGDHWLNSDPLPEAATGGEVALLLFWDFACSASLYALQYVREWHSRYRPCGLVVVGIHTPKFAFGSERDAVWQAVRRLDVEFPVVMDNGYRLWSHYGNTVWPTLVLVDREGFVRCQLDGGGGYIRFEREIRALLSGASVPEELPESMTPLRQADMPGVACYKASPELFAGYQRGSVGNVEGQIPESTSRYEDPGIYVNGRFYLEGAWLCTRDTVLNRAEAGIPCRLILPYAALEVNAVLQSEDRPPVELIVQQDDRFLTEENRGGEVRIKPDGTSVVVVSEARLYNIVRNREFGAHVLRLGARDNGLAVYSFTFVSDIISQSISKN
ncbi:MAG: hypothetical protein WBG01_17100 [Bacteroidota bacterium]